MFDIVTEHIETYTLSNVSIYDESIILLEETF